MPLPRLRSIDAYPVKHENQPMICLRDPENIVDELILLSTPAFIIASLLDGKNDAEAIQAEYTRLTKGGNITKEEIERLVKTLDDKGFLLTKKFKTMKEDQEKEFAEMKERPAFIADKSYPSEKGLLSDMLDKYVNFARNDGIDFNFDTMTGIISPHIDFNRGGNCYGFAYEALSQIREEIDTFIILGVAHVSPPTPYVITRKSYQTPLGTAETDKEFVEHIASNSTFDAYQYEITHKTEHSIEFQAVFLKHIFKHDFKIVPILCSSFEIQCKNDPMENRHIVSFINAIKKTMIHFKDKKIFIISGADLAHVGPRFGDSVPINNTLINWMESDDRKSITKIEHGDPLAFYRSVIKDGNKRKVCGLSSIYTAMKLLENRPATLLNYNYAPDPAGGMVSYCSVAFR